uniref:ATP synthase complex subunit 8 n=1 Tax=Laccoptera ruginosa TaxID=1205597 RepID=A0A0S2MNX4_9CUCU|nr:ATP synthase F0 subunit 8 [Laccoptera ruginosa]
MPQMAPLNWVSLFIMMITIMMILMTVNYFMYHKKMMKKNETKKLFYNWKW